MGSEVILVVRPERLKLRRPDTSTSTCNSLPVSIVEEIYLGSVRKLVVRMPDGSTGLVREPADASSGLHPGDEASLTWKVDDGVVVDRP